MLKDEGVRENKARRVALWIAFGNHYEREII